MITPEQEQQPQRMGGAGAYAPRELYASSIKELTDPSSDLAKFELFLRGYKISRDGTLIKQTDPLSNSKGIIAIMSIIESVVHHSNTLSNFSKDDMEFFFDTLKVDLITEVMINRIAYGIERKNRFLIIGNSMRFAYSFSKRVFEEGDRKFWKGSMTEVKHTQESIEGRKSLTMNPFSWFKK